MLGARISGFWGGTPTQHRVRDLSSGGARFDQARSLRVGSTVLVSVGALEEVGATVVWVYDDVAGLRFAQTIDPDAARSKTIVSTGGSTANRLKRTEPSPRGFKAVGTGWAANLDDPYRK
ncbi:PilZ domain-containing protein [Sphingomonas sp. SUN019]|uniref:PilZ domain-containing protein n=1 Tax=Sphingomonas sp. SUN019 TaxID=2937788 RepID=UPI0038D4A9AD